MKRSALWVAVISALGFAFFAQTVAAKSLKAAVGFPKGNAVNQAVEAFADYVEENSDLRMRVFSMSLLSLKESGPGLRDGIADVAFILTAYFPAEYAETIPFRTTPIPGLKALSDAGLAARGELSVFGSESCACDSNVESWASSAPIRASYSRLRA